jgi:outer membrane protein
MKKNNQTNNKTSIGKARNLILPLLSAFLISSFATTSNASSAKIAVINVDETLNKSLVLKDINLKIDKKKEEFQKEVSKKQEDLESEQKKLESRKKLLTKEKFDKEAQDFMKKVENFKVEIENRENILKKASFEALNKVTIELKAVVDDIAKDKSIDVVVNSNQIVFAKEDIDISNQAREALDKKISKVDVIFESSKK